MAMKVSMFEEMPDERMTKLLSMRSLGFSKIRLLPKQNGFRTIMNLKRRQQVIRNGTMTLGRSINTVMTPVFNAITHEKVSMCNLNIFEDDHLQRTVTPARQIWLFFVLGNGHAS
jgi:hypothetical protein